MSTIKIPILDLKPEIEEIADEVMASFERVMRSGHFIMGPNVKAFEAEVAEVLGTPWALGVNSGTDALFIALEALGVGPGDEVITTPFSFFATAEAVGRVGATPVFVDIERDAFNIDPACIEAAITPRTRAIIPVHLYGHAADMDAIEAIARAHDLAILEDVAQALGGEHRGRKLGTIGDAGAYSFFPSKNLGAFGDAGLLVTPDEEVARTASALRKHGAHRKYYNERVGYNSRLDEVQAAILRVKLPRLEAQNAGRRRVASAYNAMLADLDGVITPSEAPWARHVYHQYTVRILGDRRDHVREALAAEGVGTMIYYPVPIHQLPLYRDHAPTLPVAEELSREVLSLPIWPQMTDETQRTVVDALRRALNQAS
ncbi:MAG: erythromycin biosynthesis sensory transduction protein eryC1 [Myxococcales bacterium]|nr:erythromycin biosynthesis sensory transduction protein eryC1 [Myxococcales bacterium]